MDITPKEIVFKNESQQRLADGVNVLADAVKVTMGPGGENVIIEVPNGPPILTKDQCEILSEADNIVSNSHLTLQDLNLKPGDVEEAMTKWLWRYREGGQFARVK